MKLETYSRLVQHNPELIRTAFAPREHEKSKRTILTSFFHDKSDRKLILLARTLLDTATKPMDAYLHKKLDSLTKKFRVVLTLHKSSCSEKTHKLIEGLLQNHHIVYKQTEFPYQHNLAFYTVPLSDLQQHAHSLEQISAHVDLLEGLSMLDPLPKDAETILIDDQRFILSCLPKTKEQQTTYFTRCLADNARVLVSLQETSEHSMACTHFWTPSVLEKLTLPDGWTIQNIGSKQLAIGTTPNKKGKVPHIVETTLIAHKEGVAPKTLTHLHYDGWQDFHLASDENLLEHLLDRIEELKAPDQAVAINCHGGVGRTGEVATCLLLRSHIRKASLEGKDLASLPMNIPDTILRLRQQRRTHLCGKMRQLPQICTMTHRFYEGIERERSVRAASTLQ